MFVVKTESNNEVIDFQEFTDADEAFDRLVDEWERWNMEDCSSGTMDELYEDREFTTRIGSGSLVTVWIEEKK